MIGWLKKLFSRTPLNTGAIDPQPPAAAKSHAALVTATPSGPSAISRAVTVAAPFVRAGGNLGIWACVTLALLSPWVTIPGTAAVFLVSVGGNLVASILGRAGRGDPISDEEIRAALQSTDQMEAIQKLYESNHLDQTTKLIIINTALVVNESTSQVLGQIGVVRDDLTATKLLVSAELSNMSLQLNQIGQSISLVLSAVQDVGVTQQRLIAVSASAETGVQTALAAIKDVQRDIRDVSGGGRDQEAVFNAQLDDVRELLRSHNPRGALAIMRNVRASLGSFNPSPNLRSRIDTFFGATYYQLGNLSAAVVELKAAHNLTPDDPDAITNAAIGFSIEQDWTKALELAAQAMSMQAEFGHAAATAIEALSNLRLAEKLSDFLGTNDWIEHDYECQIVLGRIASGQGDYSKAADHFRKASKVDEKASLPLMLLSEAILVPVTRSLRDDPPFPGQDDNRFQRLEESDYLLTQVIEKERNADDGAMYVLALANRAGVRGRLGREEDAIADTDAALVKDPGNDVALRNKGQILLRRGQTRDAIAYFERIKGTAARQDTLLALAAGYLEIDPARTIDLLLPMWSTAAENTAIEAANMLLRAYRRLSSKDQTEAIVTELRERWPDNPSSLSVQAYQLEADERPDEALVLVNRAIELSTDVEKPWYIYQRAYLHYKLEQWVDAANDFNEISGKPAQTKDDFHFHMFAKYRAGQYEEVVSILEPQLDRGAYTTDIAELLASSYEHLQQRVDSTLDTADPMDSSFYEKAATVWEMIATEKPSYQYHLAGLMKLLNRPDQARDYLNRITFGNVVDDPELLMRIANLRHALYMPDVLRYAYRALTLRPNEPDMAVAYVNLYNDIASTNQELVLHPSVVTEECVVQLQGERGGGVVEIVKDSPTDLGRFQLSAESPEAQRLLGHKVGDLISVPMSVFPPFPLAITAINNAYAAAFERIAGLCRLGLILTPDFVIADVPIQISENRPNSPGEQ